MFDLVFVAFDVEIVIFIFVCNCWFSLCMDGER